MARRPREQPAIAKDFDDVMQFLQSSGFVPKPPPSSLLTHARQIHHATYSLILWRFRLKGLPAHGQPFIEEIASDALQILPQTMCGQIKSAKLMTRGIVENALRHIYFCDHPIEFQRMNRERRWYMTQDALLEYAKSHPLLAEAEPRFGAVAKLANLYSDLSGVIHGRTVSHMQMKTALDHLRYDDASAAEQALITKRCAEATNFLLAVFHKEKVSRFQVEDRRIILRTMAVEARRAWADL